MADFLLTCWTVFYTVFAALFLFGVTVFVHEFGHFIVARRCGLVVKTFSIGFGRAIFKWEKDGILYKIGWIPFGGYVALPQLDPEGMEKSKAMDRLKFIPMFHRGRKSPSVFPDLLAISCWRFCWPSPSG
ncbi:MAG: site-2 protease family protein [Kiritimatiellales bacterium]